ncbi:GNAT family N-acetyltransferase [Caulobacter soli]|uniref:GNAT family N-acetyltransferase n=1 Tax=Caulobacter soli TaxID=2708539 RepID=UPI001FE24ED7|nr:GNAT family N-acetyltransferase [Caulobacter soli]
MRTPPPFALRPEAEADTPFRLALFRVSRGPGWDQVPLPADLLSKIMEQQFHAQTQGYRIAYPRARLEIVTVDAAPVGRLATDRSPDAVHLIDIAIVPERRGQGIGEAILRALMDEADGAGAPLILQVARDNLAAQRLYQRLGFVATAADDTHFRLRWPAPPA